MVGTVFEEITLKNEGDEIRVECGVIKEPEIRQMTVQCVVDTGAPTLIINEAVQQELGLRTEHVKKSRMVNGDPVVCKVVETVRVCWKNRSMTCEPWVIPGADMLLLGAIPLEDMDLMVDPKRLQLVGAHGDEPVGFIY
ncbi:aspartyl protease family protein [Treponema primitia]|uniref:aspartyl protease family protein n=1 Tax=Treponema primitia TaxID=88058 RepID=UPI000255535B|nr:aspartyl protease family protein [Treponema primitia]